MHSLLFVLILAAIWENILERGPCLVRVATSKSLEALHLVVNVEVKSWLVKNGWVWSLKILSRTLNERRLILSYLTNLVETLRESLWVILGLLITCGSVEVEKLVAWKLLVKRRRLGCLVRRMTKRGVTKVYHVWRQSKIRSLSVFPFIVQHSIKQILWRTLVRCLEQLRRFLVKIGNGRGLRIHLLIEAVMHYPIEAVMLEAVKGSESGRLWRAVLDFILSERSCHLHSVNLSEPGRICSDIKLSEELIYFDIQSLLNFGFAHAHSSLCALIKWCLVTLF